MKEALLANATIFKHLAELDTQLVTHDVLLRDVYAKLRPLLAPPPEPPRKESGFPTRLLKSEWHQQASANTYSRPKASLVEGNPRHSRGARLPLLQLRRRDAGFAVSGHFITGQSWPLQNQPP